MDRNASHSAQSITTRNRRPSGRSVAEELEGRRLLSAVTYSTFLGGNSADPAFAVAADAAGNTYVTGTTASSTFPHDRGVF